MDEASKRNWKAVQEILNRQDAKIREQDQKIAQLQGQLAQLSQQFAQLRGMVNLGRGSGPTSG